LSSTETQQKKRIAILIDSLYGGGAEKVMLTLVSTLVELGHDAQIIVLSKNVDYEIPMHCTVHSLYDKKVKLKGYFRGKKHARKLKHLVSELEEKSGAFDLFIANLEETYRIASACNFDRIYYVIHNSIIETLKRTRLLGPIKYFYLKSILRKLKGKDLLTVSKGIEQELRDTQVIQARSVQTIYNPYDVESIQKLAQEKDSGIPLEPYIIHVGRAARQKRHDVLFKALKHINPKYKLVCLANDIKKLSALARSLGVSDRVIFPGFQQNPYPWIANAKAMVLSSDYEGFSNVLIESVICGTLPVSTDCPHGPNEILTGSLAQFLSERKNPQQLAEKVNGALESALAPAECAVLTKVDNQLVAQRYLSLIK
jgi:Glycosyltransferase